jgi:hypothetical protein
MNRLAGETARPTVSTRHFCLLTFDFLFAGAAALNY